MPPKKRSRETFSAETYAALDAMNDSQRTQFSPGAVEALRVAHVQFLSRIASELAQQCSENKQITLQPHHVDVCLENMDLEELTFKLQNSKMSKQTNKKATKKRKQWSAEIEAEQERLLAQSKKSMQQQQL